MTDADLQLIEVELSIALPSAYREVMLHFPLRACEGNTDTEVWDSATDLVAVNKERREIHGWPSHYFALGDTHGSVCYAMDLREPSAPVWWVYRWSFECPSTTLESPSFSEWSRKYFQDLASDLECDGIDPNGTPEQKRVVDQQNAKQGDYALVGCAVGGLVILVIARIVWEWLG